ncbi:MFS transporter, partial [Pseudomonas aeruginosa]
MPRPKLKSDDEVLEAATVVLKRCGPIEFTLSGVAKEVGLVALLSLRLQFATMAAAATASAPTH